MSFTNIDDINNEIFLQLNDNKLFKLEESFAFLLTNYFWRLRFQQKYGVNLGNTINHASVYKELCYKNLNDTFIKSVKKNYFPLVNEFVNKGINIHTDIDYALRLASKKGHLNIVDLLVRIGADINANNDEAVELASAKGHLDVLQYLINNGANINNNNAVNLAVKYQQTYSQIVNYYVSIGVRI